MQYIRRLQKQLGLRQIAKKAVICILWVLPLLSFAQNRQDLESNKQRIEREIELINQMLKETQNTAEVNLNQLTILNNRIHSRESLIRNLNNEINYIERRIQNVSRDSERLSVELDELMASYAQMIYYAYKNRSSYQRLMFIFSSRDFNQAYLRMKYLQQLAKHRQLQGEKIMETREKLDVSLEELRRQREEQQALVMEQQKEVSQLNQEKEEHTQALNHLRSRESELMARLKEQETAARELQRAIERVIAEERRRAAEAARAEGRPAHQEFRLTPEEKLVSERFADNRGKLPWPLERGVITGYFGEQPHPVLKGITIVNNGIDISTTQGARARSVFEGTVSRVVSIPGANYAVIIRHGEYLSVYANLAEVYVRNNQKISTREEIGVIATDSRDGKTHVHLEVWHGTNKLNPIHWIARQN